MEESFYVQQIKRKNFEMKVFIDSINKRLRVDHYRGDVSDILKLAEELAVTLKKEKLIFIARLEDFNELLQFGLLCEAKVDGFFCGSDAYFFTKYYQNERRKSDQWLMEDQMIQQIINSGHHNQPSIISDEYKLKKMEKSDASALSKLYQEVFKVYPTPLHEPEYIEKTMDNGTLYYGYHYDGMIVSCASADINTDCYHAELTDCATLVQHRKYGLMKNLLEYLEMELRRQGIYCAFSIARAQSFGMNHVLHQLGYQYRGRLMNNCYIFDKLEDMNMWVKDLSKE